MHLNRLMTAGFAGTAVLCMVACSSDGQNGSQGALGPSGPAGTGVAAIAAGNAHTCALTTAGAIYCWGENAVGELGNNSTTQSNVPAEVVGVGGIGFLSGATALAAGGYVESHTCALTTGGAVACWGSNSSGQLGNNSTTDSHVPVRVVGVGGTGFLSGVMAIAGGNEQTCAVTAAGAAYCWGGIYGDIGNNSTESSNVPFQVVGVGGTGFLSRVTVVAAGAEHICAATSDGSVYCWGNNFTGQLGNNSTTTTESNVPVQVLGVGATGVLSGVAAIAAGVDHTCALTTTGTVYCWGNNSGSQLGNNSTIQSNVPVQVLGVGGIGLLSGIAAISAGADYNCALTTDGAVYCWGDNKIGINSTESSNVPVQVVGVGGTGLLSGVTAITAGGSHTCALTTEGAIDCWGNNTDGQLGINSTTLSAVPVEVTGF
jgi:alpha-tubulin suppressor-like RCC1 family protein